MTTGRHRKGQVLESLAPSVPEPRRPAARPGSAAGQAPADAPAGVHRPGHRASLRPGGGLGGAGSAAPWTGRQRCWSDNDQQSAPGRRWSRPGRARRAVDDLLGPRHLRRLGRRGRRFGHLARLGPARLVLRRHLPRPGRSRHRLLRHQRVRAQLGGGPDDHRAAEPVRHADRRRRLRRGRPVDPGAVLGGGPAAGPRPGQRALLGRGRHQGRRDGRQVLQPVPAGQRPVRRHRDGDRRLRRQPAQRRGPRPSLRRGGPAPAHPAAHVHPAGRGLPAGVGRRAAAVGDTVYVYGTQTPNTGAPSSPLPQRQLFLARVPAAQLTSFGAWRFYAARASGRPPSRTPSRSSTLAGPPA